MNELRAKAFGGEAKAKVSPPGSEGVGRQLL